MRRQFFCPLMAAAACGPTNGFAPGVYLPCLPSVVAVTSDGLRERSNPGYAERNLAETRGLSASPGT